MLTVTDERAELLDLLAEFNNDAKAIARRGLVGTLSPRYAEVHRAIDDVLSTLEALELE